jgi:hypothetical protein
MPIKCLKCGGSVFYEYGEFTCINCGGQYEPVPVALPTGNKRKYERGPMLNKRVGHVKTVVTPVRRGKVLQRRGLNALPDSVGCNQGAVN